MISAILLAAGASRRFGAPKLLEDVSGKPVVRWSAESVVGIADEIVVVVPKAHDGLRLALRGMVVRWAVNVDADRGMGTSLACGVSALAANVEAALVVLGDEPMLASSAIRGVVDRYRAGGAKIVGATYGGERGHPVLFARDVFPELVALQGDVGARAVVDREPSRVVFVELGASRPVDIDTPGDLARLRR